jgi:cohesin complex subunit SA-1/2
MTTFTSRVVPRIIDMAVRDIDLRIRIQGINVLCHLDASGVLQDEEEEQRYHIACLIFDKEPRIRKAVGSLIKSMWEEQVEEMKTKDESEPVVAKKTKKGRGRPAANNEDEADEEDENDEQLQERDHRIGWKTLASLLMQLSNQLSASQKDEMADLAGSAEDTHTTQSQVQRAREVLSSVSQLTSAMDTHASIAVEALWNEIPLVQDCETLLSFLAADQSVLEKEERPWALDDDEQTFLLKMLVTGVRKTIDHDKQKRVSGPEALKN